MKGFLSPIPMEVSCVGYGRCTTVAAELRLGPPPLRVPVEESLTLLVLWINGLLAVSSG